MTKPKENRAAFIYNAVSVKSEAEDRSIRYRSKSLRDLTLAKAVPKFARSENFSYLAIGYLKCGI